MAAHATQWRMRPCQPWFVLHCDRRVRITDPNERPNLVDPMGAMRGLTDLTSSKDSRPTRAGARPTGIYAIKRFDPGDGSYFGRSRR